MKLKKILAAAAACSLAAAMLGMTAYAAPADADDETLDEPSEIIDEPMEEPEEPDEPVEVVPDPEPEPEPESPIENAPVAQNPQTGNSPIALAVIPVALAAAAVVARKAKK